MSTSSNGSPAADSSVSRFFERPILNNPYEYPRRHWELDGDGQPTHRILEGRRPAQFVTPFPTAQQTGTSGTQARLRIDEHEELSTDDEQYLTAQINTVRRQVDRWRDIPNPNDWGVTPTTARLLRHWRSHKFSGIRPFFCQVEAAETAIWLAEVAPRSRARAVTSLLRSLEDVSHAANPGLSRLALKMATGAGKTTVMAMLIAWQTINAVRHPNSPRFTRGFLVVTPGITIRDRLRVLQPNDPDAYYGKRELIPSEMLRDLNQARIVITNYHAFKLRERVSLPKGNRALLTGKTGTAPQTQETEGQMLQRVMPGLMSVKRVMVFNDEAHHCYREKPGSRDEEVLKGDDRKEANQNTEAARLWNLRAGGGGAEARRESRDGPVRHALLPPGLRLRRGNTLPLDDERLLAHGCDRVRNRQTAAGACGRQHPRRRNAHVPKAMGAHPGQDAEEGTAKGGRTRPADAAGTAPDRSPGVVRAL